MFAIYGSNVNRDSLAVLRLPLDKDPIAWWGAYVPLESWTPPKLRKSIFKGVVGLVDYSHFLAMKTQMTPSQKEIKHMSCASIATGTKSEACCPTSDIMVHMVSPPGFTANNTGRNDWDLQDCAWDNPSSEGLPKDPYASQWGHPSHDVGIASSSESMADAYDCGWDNPMHYEIITLPGKSRDDLYDCGWDDLMDHQFIMESAVMAEQHCGDVNPSVAEDPYDCRWDAVCPAGMQEMNTMSSNMQNILCDMPSEAYTVFGMRMVDQDQTPAVMQMANQNVLGTYVDTVIKVTELSEDVATIHHFPNVQCRIMEQLDNMIAICERDGWAT
ncbi:hypothetical protein BDR06DRAFT_969479 [Suillus hirtellus]|nr:hypothetical protein BDR06DRAFT_969479 [Suillus hirtellus]